MTGKRLIVVTDHERTRIAQAAADHRMAPDGPTIERFQPLAMATILEHEAERALLLGMACGTPGKVDIYMDPRDALELAAFLRKHGG